MHDYDDTRLAVHDQTMWRPTGVKYLVTLAQSLLLPDVGLVVLLVVVVCLDDLASVALNVLRSETGLALTVAAAAALHLLVLRPVGPADITIFTNS